MSKNLKNEEKVKPTDYNNYKEYENKYFLITI